MRHGLSLSASFSRTAAMFLALWTGTAVLPSSSLVADDTPSVASPKGSLVIIGGALRFEDKTEGIWSRFVELAGGPGAEVAVFPTASSQPMESGARIVNMLKRMNVNAFIVPLGVRNIETDYKVVAADPHWVERVSKVKAVFFTGGSQANITKALYREDGSDTPLLDTVRKIYRDGGVIAGTSAGAAMMSGTMFAHPPSGVLRVLQGGVSHGKELAKGLGFLGTDWFVEQHCLVRGRFARAVLAMTTAGIPYGIGVDEDTAVVVSQGREMEVIGYKGAIIMDCSAATKLPDETRFNVSNVKLSYLDHGDKMDLKTLAITPYEPKVQHGRIEPATEGFVFSSGRKLHFADILGNTTVTDVMAELLTNRHGEAKGLAFDVAASMEQETETPGWEFKLYRAPDTHGWQTDVRGHDAVTVANMRLDVRPVMIQPRWYRAAEPVTPVAPSPGAEVVPAGQVADATTSKPVVELAKESAEKPVAAPAAVPTEK
jgi:cyanophycinase